MVDTGDLKSPGKSRISNEKGEFQPALANNLQKDSDLQRVLDAWPSLPAALKAGILAMIDAAR